MSRTEGKSEAVDAEKQAKIEKLATKIATLKAKAAQPKTPLEAKLDQQLLKTLTSLNEPVPSEPKPMSGMSSWLNDHFESTSSNYWSLTTTNNTSATITKEQLEGVWQQSASPPKTKLKFLIEQGTPPYQQHPPSYVDAGDWTASKPRTFFECAAFMAYALRNSYWNHDEPHMETGGGKYFGVVTGRKWRSEYIRLFGKDDITMVDIVSWFEDEGCRNNDDDYEYDIACCQTITHDQLALDEVDLGLDLTWCAECCMPCQHDDYNNAHERCDDCAEGRHICHNCEVSFHMYDGHECEDCATGEDMYCDGCSYYSEDEDQYFCADHIKAHNDIDGAMGEASGDMSIPPWEHRGIFFQAAVPEHADYETVWNFDPKSLDPLTAAADFYLMETVEHAIHLPHEPTGWNVTDGLRMLMAEAREIRAAIVTTYDEAFRKYCDIAIGGEIRYHQAVSGRVIPGKDRTRAWCGWKAVRDHIGPQALLDAAEMFRELGGSIGGEPWAVSAEILHARVTNRITPAQFCDRIFTLAHNGGSFLNKVRWGGWFHHNHEGIRETVGPAHSSNPTQYHVLVHFATTAEIFYRYIREVNKARRFHGLAPIDRRLAMNKPIDPWLHEVHYLPHWAWHKAVVNDVKKWRSAHA